MFRIQRYETPLGADDAMRLVNDSMGEFFERKDAVAYVEKYAATHNYWGYKKRQDSWWCRNEGDEIVKTLVVCPR